MITLANYLDRNFRFPAHDTAKFERYHYEIEHLRYCSKLIDKYDLMPQELSDFVNDDDTDECLAMYTQHDQNQQPRLALTWLNRAIAAGCDGEEVAQCYTVRAEHCLKLKAYDECMVNLKLARAECGTQYVKTVHFKKIEALIEENVLRRMLEAEYAKIDSDIGVPFDGRRSKSLPFEFHKSVQLRRSTYGPQTVYAAGALPAGMVVGIDQAMVSSLCGGASATRCSHCQRESLLTLMPCSRPGCPAMFCDVSCQTEALYSVHNYECDIMPFLAKYEQCRPVMRLVFSAFRSKGSVVEMMAFDRRCEPKHNNIFTYAEMPKLPGNYYAKLAWTLTRQRRTRSNADRFYYSRVASIVYEVIKLRTYLVQDLFRRRSERIFLRRFIFEGVCMLADCGREHRLPSAVRFTDERPRNGTVAHCLFPVAAMLRHSCTPNVAVRACGIDRQVMYTVRPIAANEPLTVDRTFGRGGSVVQHKQQTRLMFSTECDCPEAAAHMPFPNEMSACRAELPVPWSESSDQMRTMFAQPRALVRRYYDQTARYLNVHAALYPCRELHVARRCFEVCLDALALSVDRHFATDELGMTRKRNELLYIERELTKLNVTSTDSPCPPDTSESERKCVRTKRRQENGDEVSTYTKSSGDEATTLTVGKPQRLKPVRKRGERVDARKDSLSTLQGVSSMTSSSQLVAAETSPMTRRMQKRLAKRPVRARRTMPSGGLNRDDTDSGETD